MPQTTLFTAKDLTDWLKRPVKEEHAAIAEKVVWGWLDPVLKTNDVRPDPVPSKVFAWALELGGIAHVNPEGLESYQLEDEESVYSKERRDEILALAAGGGTTPGTVAAKARGRFPRARRYPDPAERCWSDGRW